MNQLAYPILDDSACQKHWVDYLPNTEICAGYENSTKDFCAVSIRKKKRYIYFQSILRKQSNIILLCQKRVCTE